MAKKQSITPSHRAYIEQKLAHVEPRRSQPFWKADVERILRQIQSEDELIRASAARPAVEPERYANEWKAFRLCR